MKTKTNNRCTSVRLTSGLAASVLFTNLMVTGILAAGEAEFSGGAIRTSRTRAAGTETRSELKTAEVQRGFLGLPVPQQWQNSSRTASQRRYQPVRTSVTGSRRASNGLQNSADSEWTPRTADRSRTNDSGRFSDDDRRFDDRRPSRSDRDNLLSTRELERLTDGRDLNRLSGTRYFPSSRSRGGLVRIGSDYRDAGYLDREDYRDMSPSSGDCPNGNCSRTTGYRGYQPGAGVMNPACPNGRCGTGSCPNGNCSTGNCSTGNCSTGNCSTGNCPNGNCSTAACPNGRCGTPAFGFNPTLGLNPAGWGFGGATGMRRGPAMPSRR